MPTNSPIPDNALDQLIAFWKEEEIHPFIGWDFSHLNGRMHEEPLPWSYPDRAGTLMAGISSVLDINTGGGERLLDLKAYWPDKVVATEEYAPNFRLAKTRLEPAGATVIDAKWNDLPMPLADGAFDLILNRHSAFAPAEIARLLAHGGTFLTQQVHGLWAHDLLAAFDAVPQWPDASPSLYVPQLQAAGLEIVAIQDWTGRLSFTDVGAVVYYLKAVPWLVPDFTVERYLDNLVALQRQLWREHRLDFEARKYRIEAKKSD